MGDIAVRAENLGKEYRIGAAQQRAYRTIRETVTEAVQAPFRRAGGLLRGQASGAAGLTETIWALQNVSFEIKRGDVVGIIGRNGAGKSTLLKILSRITEPTTGRVEIHGRVGSLLEVGTGFHPELTGRENIYLNGAILGMSRNDIERQFDEIVAFAEVERFIDTPVKHYSSGMYLRLAFAVAAHLEPEILLVDEVLAVGDAAFQKKCLGKMGDVAKSGRTILFVSHNMASIRELCSTCIWVDEGGIREYGLSSSVVDRYLRDSDASQGSAECRFEEDTTKAFQLSSARLRNRRGDTAQLFECDEPVIVDLYCQVRQPLPGLYGYLAISQMDGTTVMVSDSHDIGPNPLDGLRIGAYTLSIAIPPRTLGVGDYSVYVNFTSQMNADGFIVDSPGTLFTFRLEDNVTRRGPARLGFFSTLLSWNVSCRNEDDLLPTLSPQGSLF